MVLIDSNSTVLKIGDQMPHFDLQDTDLDRVRSRDIDQPVVVVVFTCNHCPYAKAVEDRLIRMAEEFGEEDVQFVLINSNDAEEYPDDSFEEMQIRAEEKSYPFPYCSDESQEVARSFGALCTPHCFVFDTKRKLRYKGRVDDNWKEPSSVKEHTLRDAIAAVVAGKDPPRAEANAMGCSIKWRESVLV